MVQQALSNSNHGVLNCLGKVKEDAFDFNLGVFGNVFKRKHILKARMRGIQCTLEHYDILSLVLVEANLRREYNDVLKQEVLLWFQKYREKWVRFGDHNAKFFSLWQLSEETGKKIHGLILEDGSWCTEDSMLKVDSWVNLRIILPLAWIVFFIGSIFSLSLS